MTKLNSRSRLKKLQSKSYRDTYLDGHVKSTVANQIYALRYQCGETQGKFAKRVGMAQAAVSRLEDEEYGNVTVNTLLNIAKGANVGLLVKFVSYPEMLGAFPAGFDPDSLAVESVDVSLARSDSAVDFAKLEGDFYVSGIYPIFKQINETLIAGVFATIEVGSPWQPETIEMQPPSASLPIMQQLALNPYQRLEMKTSENITATYLKSD